MTAFFGQACQNGFKLPKNTHQGIGLRWLVLSTSNEPFYSVGSGCGTADRVLVCQAVGRQFETRRIMASFLLLFLSTFHLK